jgi:hypothetical protein
MIEVTLKPVANQSVSIILDGSRYDLAIKEANGVMVADVARDNVILVSGARIVAKTPLLPYDYLQEGNFVIATENDELPDWPGFGTTQALLYVSPAEIEALRGQ